MSASGAAGAVSLATVALAALIVAVPLAVYTWGRDVGHLPACATSCSSGARPAHARALRSVLRRRFLGANLFLVSTARVRAALAGIPVRRPGRGSIATFPTRSACA